MIFILQLNNHLLVVYLKSKPQQAVASDVLPVR